MFMPLTYTFYEGVIFMEKMNLKDARVLKARLGKTLTALAEKREKVAVVTIMPGEDPNDFIDVSVDELTGKIDSCIERLLLVGAAIRLANVGMVMAASETEDIASMVEKSILLRREASYCKALGEKNPKHRERGGYGSDDAQLVDVTTYDIAKYAERAKKLASDAEKLSAKIDRLDLETMVEI